MRFSFATLLSLFALLFLLFSTTLEAQVGLSVSPPRVYYSLDAGETGSQRVLVNNISNEYPLHLSFTFGDWKYDEYGNNRMFPPDTLDNSCANWLSLPEGAYMTLEPGESREVNLTMTVPTEMGREENVQTAMLFVTQMNPVDGVDAQGAAIRINVRQGIKIYRKGDAAEIRRVDIKNLAYNKEAKMLELTFANDGNSWVNGWVDTSLFNRNTGKEMNLDTTDFYTMPGDLRIMAIPFKQELEKGEYTATVMIDYGDVTTIEAAELQFNHD